MWQNVMVPNILKHKNEPVSNKEVERGKKPKPDSVPLVHQENATSAPKENWCHQLSLYVAWIVRVSKTPVKHHGSNQETDEIEESFFESLAYDVHDEVDQTFPNISSILIYFSFLIIDRERKSSPILPRSDEWLLVCPN